MSEYEEFEHNGKTIRIHYDNDRDWGNPRDADNLGVMLATGHRNYTLGDEGYSFGDEYETAKHALNELAERGLFHLFPRWARIYLGSTVVLKLGLIDHSGISMYVGGGAHLCDPGGWDSGTVGFIFDTEKTRERVGGPRDGDIERALRTEVEQYDLYLTGQVFRFEILDEDEEEEDGCGGFLGIEWARHEARHAAGYTCKHCNQSIHRWHGAPGSVVIDAEASSFEQGGWVHNGCSTCGLPVKWGGDGHYHSTVKPWDWPDGKPDHVADSGRWHQCADKQHVGDTDQTEEKLP